MSGSGRWTASEPESFEPMDGLDIAPLPGLVDARLELEDAPLDVSPADRLPFIPSRVLKNPSVLTIDLHRLCPFSSGITTG